VTVLVLVTVLAISAVSVVSALDAPVVVAPASVSISVAVLISGALHALATRAHARAALRVVRAVYAHLLVRAHLALGAIAVLLAPDANVLLANSPVEAVAVIGALNALLLVAHTVAIVVRITIVWLQLVGTGASSDRDNFGFD